MNKNQEKAIEQLYEEYQKNCPYMVDTYKECRFRVYESEDGEIYVYRNEVYLNFDNDGLRHKSTIYKVDEAGHTEELKELTKWLDTTHNFLNKLKLHKQYV